RQLVRSADRECETVFERHGIAPWSHAAVAKERAGNRSGSHSWQRYGMGIGDEVSILAPLLPSQLVAPGDQPVWRLPLRIRKMAREMDVIADMSAIVSRKSNQGRRAARCARLQTFQRSAACAAARRAIGTLKGEHET